MTFLKHNLQFKNQALLLKYICCLMIKSCVDILRASLNALKRSGSFEEEQFLEIITMLMNIENTGR